jgi:hypothetical protein
VLWIVVDVDVDVDVAKERWGMPIQVAATRQEKKHIGTKYPKGMLPLHHDSLLAAGSLGDCVFQPSTRF